SDNAGFALAMSGKDLEYLFEGIPFEDHIAIFGEWCGGNIQKGVAICELPKMFVIFGCMVDGQWINSKLSAPSQGIHNIQEFTIFTVHVDFNKPEEAQNTLLDMTLAVEECCPVAYQLSGRKIVGIGEGLVFTCDTDPSLRFKSKGEKH